MSNESVSAKTFCATHLEKCWEQVADVTCFEVVADEMLESWARYGSEGRTFYGRARHRAHAKWLLQRSAQLRDKMERGKQKAERLKSSQ